MVHPHNLVRYRAGKFLRLILLFYQSFAVAGWLVTGTCACVFYLNGIQAFEALFWVKAVTSAVMFCFLYTYRKPSFFYFMNLGISRKVLLTGAFGMDAVIFIICMLMAYKFR